MYGRTPSLLENIDKVPMFANVSVLTVQPARFGARVPAVVLLANQAFMVLSFSFCSSFQIATLYSFLFSFLFFF